MFAGQLPSGWKPNVPLNGCRGPFLAGRSRDDHGVQADDDPARQSPSGDREPREAAGAQVEQRPHVLTYPPSNLRDLPQGLVIQVGQQARIVECEAAGPNTPWWWSWSCSASSRLRAPSTIATASWTSTPVRFRHPARSCWGEAPRQALASAPPGPPVGAAAPHPHARPVPFRRLPPTAHDAILYARSPERCPGSCTGYDPRHSHPRRSAVPFCCQGVSSAQFS